MAEESLDSIIRLLAEDPKGFEAKISAYRKAAAAANAAAVLLAKAEEIPHLHRDAKAAATKAHATLKSAEERAAAVTSLEEQLVAVVAERADLAEQKAAIEKARKDLEISERANEAYLAKLDDKAARIAAIVAE